MQPEAYTTPLEPGLFYHIYNRGNNYQQVFKCAADYDFFLEKWQFYIYPIARTFAYNLLPNHFHAIVQIREEPLIKPTLIQSRLGKSGTPVWVTRAFTNFFISFARKMQNRHGFHGAVFHSPFKRKRVGDDVFLDYLTAYVHFNAHKHGLYTGPVGGYPHSSYQRLLSDMPTFLERDFVMDFFGGHSAFIDYHLAIARLFDIRGGPEF